MTTDIGHGSIIFWNTLNVKGGKLEALKKTLKKLCDLVTTETGTFTYNFAFNQDETQVFATEIYANTEAVLEHFKNVGEVLPELMENHIPGSLTVIAPKEEHEKLKELLAELPYTSGFTFVGVKEKTME